MAFESMRDLVMNLPMSQDDKGRMLAIVDGVPYTEASPEKPKEKKERKQRDPSDNSQLPVDSDEEDILITVSPKGYEKDETIKTFVFKNEGHTLGTILKDQLLKYPEVHFAGYSIPHPDEKEMHLRIQTNTGSKIPAKEILKKALKDVMSMCDHVEEEFVKKSEKFEEDKKSAVPSTSGATTSSSQMN